MPVVTTRVIPLFVAMVACAISSGFSILAANDDRLAAKISAALPINVPSRAFLSWSISLTSSPTAADESLAIRVE
jgi:hypothetical protein